MYGDEGVMYNKPRDPMKRMWAQYRFPIIGYSALAVFILIVYHFLSDKDFSFLMTLGSLFVCAAFGLLVLKVTTTRSVQGISAKTLTCYALVFSARLSSILFYEGYLPLDRSGDWFYRASEVLALVLVLGILFSALSLYRRSYGAAMDTFGAGALPNHLGVLFLIVPAAVLAIILHPSLNNNWLTDTAWTFALYLEAVAIVPQLYMFQRERRDKEVEPYTANFVFCIAVARMLHFVFWLSSYQELNERGGDFSRMYPGYLVVFSQIVNLVVMGDYIYYYMESAHAQRHGVILPRTI